MKVTGEKVELRNATAPLLDKLYYWRFEEKQQQAKKWNGPYIPKTWISIDQHRKTWLEKDAIANDVPASLVILVDDKTIGYVGAYWIDQNTNWLETGVVI